MNNIKLDTNITPELLLEGILNEFEHRLAQALKRENVLINSESIPRKLVEEVLQETRKVEAKDIAKWQELGYIKF